MSAAEEGEEILMEVVTHHKSGSEKYVLQVVRFRGGLPRIEKRRFLLEDGRWWKDKPVSIIAPDVRAILQNGTSILEKLDK